MARWVKLGLGVFVGLVALAAIGLALAPPIDIRPAEIRGRAVDADNEARGRQLLAQVAERYGGLERWRSLRATRAVLTDFWPAGLMKTMGSPWRDGETLELTYLHGRDTARLVFRGGERDGHAWGIQNWLTYTRAGSAPAEFAPNNDIKFWLPTIAYFFELPFRLVEASVVQYVGERHLDGRTYDLVYLTWNSPEPQADVDQYVAWINRKTGMLDYTQYTVRDTHKLIAGGMHCSDYRTIDGVVIPFVMSASGSPEEPQLMHRFDVKQVQFLPQLPESELIVDATRVGTK